MAFPFGQDFVHLVEFPPFFQLQRGPNSCWIPLERSEQGLVEDQVDPPAGGENESISGSADFFRNREWSNGFWSEFQSWEAEGEIPGVEVDKVSGLMIVGFMHMLVVCVFVLGLCV